MNGETLKIEDKLPLLEEILDEWKPTIGSDFQGYKNHVYRMVNFCFAQNRFMNENRDKIIIAGCFHDLGIWSDKTFDYISPSIELAKNHLEKNRLKNWIPEIETMIEQHHKLTKYENGQNPLTEIFRKGDLIDFSLGFFKCGLPKTYIKSVKKHFPNNGFHKCLLKVSSRWILKHPLNPLPVIKL